MNPIAFEIFGLSVHWYGLIIGAGLVLAMVLAVFIMHYRGFKRDLPLELILWLFIPAVIGARLYFLIFNGGPWDVRALYIWEGGMAIYGGVIGGAIGLAIWCLVKKINFLTIADVIVPCLALGQCIGRWGNYVNQEAFGAEVTNPAWQSFPWAVFIERTGSWHMATFFYESVANLIIVAVLLILLKKVRVKGIVLSAYLILYGIVRFILECVRIESLMVGEVPISQIVSGLIIVGGLVLLIVQLVRYKKGKEKPVEVRPFRLQVDGTKKGANKER